MSNYTKTVDFAAKDTLPSGDSGKIIKGTEFETEFDNISTAIATKADSAAPTFTGTSVFTNLDINGTVQADGAVTVGVDDTGYDVKFFGATAGKSLLWDESADSLIVTGTTTLVGTTNLDAVDVDGDMTFGDNNKAIFGAESDLQIYHDGNHSYIKDTLTGNLRIDGTDIQIRSTAGANMAAFVTGAEVQLYHNNQKKFETTVTGVDVTGIVVADGIESSGNFAFTAADGMTISAKETVQITIDSDDNDSSRAFQVLSGSSGSTETLILASEDAGVTLYYDNAQKFATTSTGIDVTGSVTADGLDVNSTTSGAANIQVGNAAGDIALGIGSPSTANKVVVTAGGSVGIGTDSPQQLLSVVKNQTADTVVEIANLGTAGASTTASFVVSEVAGTPKGWFRRYRDGTDRTSIGYSGQFTVESTSGTEAIRIDSSQNLLVGTTDTTIYNNSANNATDNGMVYSAVDSRLDVTRYTTNAVAAVASFNRTGNDGSILSFARSGTLIGSIGVNTGDMYLGTTAGTTDNYIRFAYDTSFIIPASSAGAENDAAISLGHVNSRFKDLHLSGASYNGDGSTAAPSISFGADTNTGFYRVGSDKIGFVTAGTLRAMLDASGNLLVGKTNDNNAVAGVALSGTGLVKVTRTDWSLLLNRIGSTSGSLALFQYDSGTVGSISVTASATAYNTSSDQRLKENIADADDAGVKIDAIQVRKFDWKADGSHQDYGMVAQELLEVAPEAVSAPEDPEEMMGVDYSKLVPMMLKEIQSLRARVAQLES